ncbi:hypothetical protein LSCM4_01177 [Leishmania orientalis]|uniref:Uncharacterized protein n=1 Tax=Leishmania orientalis TaxID=2249476 RepID=A0A836H171_9TRYP|nr:hypothetical protein LSCM4_01177 [Leishmania orientalis]
MYARDVHDRISGISAADLAQRLVERSTRRLAQESVVAGTPSQWPPPQHVSALLWDAKYAGGAPPRTALLRGDAVEVASCMPDETLSCVALSDDVRFRFARSRRRRLTGILSSTAASSLLRISHVDVTHFYWMDECAPTVTHGEGAVLQKCIVQWAVNAFARNPLLRNISLQTIEAVFPALLAFSRREREDLLEQAAELLGQGTLIWYGSAMIKQFHESAASLTLSLLTSREARNSAALLFALATAHDVMGTRFSDATRAVRFLSEVYGLQTVASSPALTTALLLTLRATAPAYACPGVGKKPHQHHLLEPYLFPLSCADAATLHSILHSASISSHEHYRDLLRRVRSAAAAVLTTAPQSTLIATRRTHAHEDDINAFFAANQALEIQRDTLVAHSRSDVPPSLSKLTAAYSGTAARARLLESAPKWWELQAKAGSSDVAGGETELKIHLKAASAALRESHGSDHALLAAIHRSRKRQRHKEQLTSQAVEAALEGASIRLKRRVFLQLVDIMALNADDEERGAKTRQYLEQHHIAETQICDFIALLSSKHKM